MGGIVCSGNIRVAHVDSDGVPTGGYIGIVNAVKLAITIPDPDTKSRLSKQNESFGQALDTVFFNKPVEIQIDTDDTGDAEILAWSLGGTPSAYTQSSATVTAQETVAQKDEWVRIPNRRISSYVLKDATDVTTYTLGTDYLVDLEAGFYKILTGSAIADGATLHQNYTAPALTGKSISGGTRPSIQVAIDGDMVNLANNKRVHLVVPKSKLSASGGLDFMGSDFLVTSMKGTCVVVTGLDPYTAELIDS